MKTLKETNAYNIKNILRVVVVKSDDEVVIDCWFFLNNTYVLLSIV